MMKSYKKIDRAVFQELKGAFNACYSCNVSFKEALDLSFKEYQKQVVLNAKKMADEFTKLGYRVISKTTDNHLLMVDVKGKLGITGLDAENILGKVNITCNKNAIPFETEKLKYTSGLRFGSADDY